MTRWESGSGCGGPSGDKEGVMTRNFLAFIRGLRKLGFDVASGELELVMKAISLLGFESESTCRDAVESIVVHRPEQIPLFRAAWYQFWLRLRRSDAHAWVSEQTLSANVARLRENRHRHPQVIWLGAEDKKPLAETPADEDFTVALKGGASSLEVLRQMDFAKLTEVEQAQLWRLQDRLQPLWKPTRRKRKSNARGGIDFGETLRRAATRGEWLPLTHHRAKFAQRGVVLFCDVSGSMEAYSRMLLRFAHGLLQAGVRLEVFLFSTRLTRVTRWLTEYNPDRALAEVGARTLDFAGGTRMVDALFEFHRDYARTALRKSPVFLIATDGFDTADCGNLEMMLRRIRRLCRTVLWLNPMMGDVHYQPEASAALVLKAATDGMFPAYNWDSLERLWQHVHETHRRPIV